MADLKESQKRYLALFAEYVDVESGRILDREFEDDIKILHEKMPLFVNLENIEEEARRSSSQYWESFLVKYGFNRAMSDFLEYFVQTGVILPSLINSGIYVVSEADRTAEGRIVPPEVTHYIYQSERVRRGQGQPAKELKIVIPAGVTQNQLKDFIQEHWKGFISVKQEMYRDRLDQPRGRVKSSNSKLRSRIKELAGDGIPYGEIANIINEEFTNKHYSYGDIAQLVYLYKIKKSQK